MHHIYYNMHVMAYKCQYIIEIGVNWLFIFFHGAYTFLCSSALYRLLGLYNNVNIRNSTC